MSTVIAESFSQPSKAYNIAYLLFSYAVTFSLVPMTDFGDPSEYLIFVAIIGGFFGTFLFFLKPFENLIYILFKLGILSDVSSLFTIRASSFTQISDLKRFQWVFYSKYLSEVRGKIIGGLCFFTTCLIITFYNANFKIVSIENVLIIKIFLNAKFSIF